jgi:hypothetical protein
MEYRRRKRRLPDPVIPSRPLGAPGLGPLIYLLFGMLVLIAGYLALARFYDEQAGDYRKPAPPKTATPQSGP